MQSFFFRLAKTIDKYFLLLYNIYIPKIRHTKGVLFSNNIGGMYNEKPVFARSPGNREKT